VWTPVNYTISYELDGGSVSEANPTQYTAADAFTLNNPTKEDCEFLGWNGSNGMVPQTEITIVKGSTGNRTYTANWVSNAAKETVHLIAVIGPVTYSEASKDAIEAARAAYTALSETEKIRVSNYNILLAAEQTYEKAKEQAEGNTTVQFVAQDGTTPVGSRKIALNYPEAPEIAGFTFLRWQTIEEDITGGTIRLQAVYKANDPTAVDRTDLKSEIVNHKLIKNGNVYILTDEFIYTINGQRVK